MRLCFNHHAQLAAVSSKGLKRMKRKGMQADNDSATKKNEPDKYPMLVHYWHMQLERVNLVSYRKTLTKHVKFWL